VNLHGKTYRSLAPTPITWQHVVRTISRGSAAAVTAFFKEQAVKCLLFHRNYYIAR